MTFYSLASDTAQSPLQDEIIRQEVLDIKNVVQASHYKSRLIVVLLGAGDISHTDLEDRLVKIRKTANIDSRTLYYLPASTSHIDVLEFAESLLSAIYPLAVEYYRDLSKQIRRKRNRKANVQTHVNQAEIDTALSTQGWTVRYEFKLAVLAEFRQEMDAACRTYETTYHAVLTPENLASPIVSPRARETQILLDAIVIRIIRCFCWTLQSSQAVRWWRKHRDQMQKTLSLEPNAEDISRWTSWQLVWTTTMADIISGAGLFSAQYSSIVYLPASNGLLVPERHNPWDSLHHEGYWLRRVLEIMTPTDTPDDRQVILSRTTERFQKFGQARLLQWLMLEQMRKTTRRNDKSSPDKLVLSFLRSEDWILTGWWALHQEVKKLTASLEIDRLHSTDGILDGCEFDANPAMHSTSHEYSRSLLGVVEDQRFADISLSFAFATVQGHVGEPLRAQFGLHLRIPHNHRNLYVTEALVELSGSAPSLRLVHSRDKEASTSEQSFRELVLEEAQLTRNTDPEMSNTAYVDLTPRTNHILNIDMPVQREGRIQLKRIVLTVHGGDNEATSLVFERDLIVTQQWWEVKQGNCHPRPFGRGCEGASVEILPRLPRLSVYVANSRPEFYIRESAVLMLSLDNSEEEEVAAEIRLSVRGPFETRARIEIEGGQNADMSPDAEDRSNFTLESIKAGDVVSQGVVVKDLFEPGRYQLTVNIDYHLKSDITRRIRRQTGFELNVVQPFEAHGSFTARVDTQEWPKFFTMSDVMLEQGAVAAGLRQRYSARISLVSCASVDLEVRSIKLTAQHITGRVEMLDSYGQLVAEDGDMSGLASHVLQPGRAHQYAFDLTIQQRALGERTPVAIAMAVELEWSRDGPGTRYLASLPVPSLVANISEPRVLMETHYIDGEPQLLQLTYTIENPSIHFLTFKLTIERGDQYAFSGPKARSVSLTPLSRTSVSYRLYARRSQEWLPVNLEVLDTFFGQVLGVQPASDSIRLTKAGGIEVWSGDSQGITSRTA